MWRNELIPLFPVLFCDVGDQSQTVRISMERISRAARKGLCSLPQFPPYVKKTREPISEYEISMDFGLQLIASFYHHFGTGENELGIAYSKNSARTMNWWW